MPTPREARKVRFDRQSCTTTVEGRIAGIGHTIRIEANTVKYKLRVPPEVREATEWALLVHTEGCPAHQSVKAAIAISWEATLHGGDEVVVLASDQATSNLRKAT